VAGAERRPERGVEAVETERLRRAWDDLAASDARPPDGCDPALLETVRRLHLLDRGESAPSASAGFIRRLEAELMQGATLPSTVRPTAGAPSPLDGRLPRLEPAGGRPRLDRQSTGRFGALAAAAVVLLTLATAFAAYRLLPPVDGGGTTTQRAAPAAEPRAAEGLPTAAECRIAPAPIGRMFPVGTPSTEPLNQAGSDSAASAPIPLDDLPSGPPAARETVDAIAATLRERNACRSARDLARQAALHTEDYWRRADTAFENPEELASYGTPPAVIDGDEEPVPEVVEVRMLPDGRAAALLVEEYEEGITEDGRGYRGFASPSVAVFARSGERWLIDDESWVDARPLAFLDLQVDDAAPKQLGAWEGDDIVLLARNSTGTSATVANRALGLRRVVAPGTVERIRLEALPVGEYEIVGQDPGGARPERVLARLVVAEAEAPSGRATPTAENELTV